MITVTVDGDMLVITVGDETTEIPLWLIRSWQDEAAGGPDKTEPEQPSDY